MLQLPKTQGVGLRDKREKANEAMRNFRLAVREELPSIEQKPDTSIASPDGSKGFQNPRNVCFANAAIKFLINSRLFKQMVQEMSSEDFTQVKCKDILYADIEGESSLSFHGKEIQEVFKQVHRIGAAL